MVKMPCREKLVCRMNMSCAITQTEATLSTLHHDRIAAIFFHLFLRFNQQNPLGWPMEVQERPAIDFCPTINASWSVSRANTRPVFVSQSSMSTSLKSILHNTSPRSGKEETQLSLTSRFAHSRDVVSTVCGFRESQIHTDWNFGAWWTIAACF